MNHHDREDMHQEIALEGLRGTTGGRAWISAYRKVVRTKHGRMRRCPEPPRREPAGEVAPERPWERMAPQAWRSGLLPLHDPDSLGGRLRLARMRKGLTQLELAALSGMTNAHVSQVELGRADLSVRALRRLASALGIRPGELLDPST